MSAPPDQSKSAEWPSKEAHDRVRAAYMKWTQKNYPGYKFSWAPVEIGPGSGFCDCCASRRIPPDPNRGHEYGWIHLWALTDGVLPNMGEYDNFVIRDKDIGDHALAWMNA